MFVSKCIMNIDDSPLVPNQASVNWLSYRHHDTDRFREVFKNVVACFINSGRVFPV